MGRSSKERRKVKSQSKFLATETSNLNVSAPAFVPNSVIRKPVPPRMPAKLQTKAMELGVNEIERATADTITKSATGRLSGIKLVRTRSDCSQLLNVTNEVLKALPLQRSAASELALTLNSELNVTNEVLKALPLQRSAASELALTLNSELNVTNGVLKALPLQRSAAS